MKKIIRTVVIFVIVMLVILVGSSFFDYNTKNQKVLIIQLGKVVRVVEEPGVFFKFPIIQSTKSFYVGERLYDVQESEVITSDKKTMIADCYVVWKIADIRKYYQSVSSESVAQSRIDVEVYNTMKNVISSTKQDDVISGKDGSLSEAIMDKISMQQYGIEVTENEVKLLDLPNDNKDAVYKRMISERQVIASEHQANGEKDSQNLKSATDAKVRQTISEAKVVAAQTEAEGESEYFRILAESYGASRRRQEFYNFVIGLDAMKESLSNGGTITIDKDSPLYKVITNDKN